MHVHGWDRCKVASILPFRKHPNTLFLFVLTPHLLPPLCTQLSPLPLSPLTTNCLGRTHIIGFLRNPPRDERYWFGGARSPPVARGGGRGSRHRARYPTAARTRDWSDPIPCPGLGSGCDRRSVGGASYEVGHAPRPFAGGVFVPPPSSEGKGEVAYAISHVGPLPHALVAPEVTVSTVSNVVYWRFVPVSPVLGGLGSYARPSPMSAASTLRFARPHGSTGSIFSPRDQTSLLLNGRARTCLWTRGRSARARGLRHPERHARPPYDLVLGAGVAHALQMPALVPKAIEPESSVGVSGGRRPPP